MRLTDSQDSLDFYQILDEALQQIPKNDKILLLGDSMLVLGRTVGYGKEYLAGMGLVRPTQMA